jgi:KipI family sensor histidine kinase inhibitor
MQAKIYTSPHYLPFGDSALIIEFGEVISPEANQKVLALNQTLSKANIAGVEETVPTYRSLLIRYNPLKTTYEQLVFQIKDIEKNLNKLAVGTEGRRMVVPVVYGGEYGPDIGFVAKYHGITEEMVVKLHSEREYRVYMIGFVAGFPYLGEVPDEIATPRLETPRIKVPAGSLGIAEKQTGIYPCEAPGGWQIIGRTPLKLFNPLQQPPALLRPGDIVKFKPISESEFKTIEEAILKSEWKSFSEEQ